MTLWHTLCLKLGRYCIHNWLRDYHLYWHQIIMWPNAYLSSSYQNRDIRTFSFNKLHLKMPLILIISSRGWCVNQSLICSHGCSPCQLLQLVEMITQYQFLLENNISKNKTPFTRNFWNNRIQLLMISLKPALFSRCPIWPLVTHRWFFLSHYRWIRDKQTDHIWGRVWYLINLVSQKWKDRWNAVQDRSHVG